MTKHAIGPWEWKWGGLWVKDTETNILMVAGDDGEEYVGGNDANKSLIAAAPETKAQLDRACLILKQALPFVTAWAHNHPDPEGYASPLAMRLAARMQARIAAAKGE